ncbi:BglG family transcription antiterminator [Streptococcus halichoeri]|uniref:BglG family transcription antiterminator n=1 Tax=Streptococcus halichoeri TaxID=254785 RepID=UPI00135C2CEF|nr:PTS sugar transporter subunit IIA [Streptococcus halichoeri]
MNNRQCEILTDLIENPNYLSASNLSKKYNVSTKTILSDIKKIGDSVQKYNLSIEKKPRYGIRLLNFENLESENYILLNELIGKNKFSDFSKRKSYYIQELAFERQYKSVGELSDLLYLSDSTVRRDLEKLQQEFLPYGLLISKNEASKYLVGDEMTIRANLRNYLLDYYCSDNIIWQESDVISEIFRDDNPIAIGEEINRLARKFSFTVSHQYIIYLLVDVLITRKRYLKNIGNGNIRFDEMSKIYPTFFFAVELLSFSSMIDIEKLNIEDITYISRSIISVAYKNEVLTNDHYVSVVTQFISKVSDISGIDFTSVSSIKTLLLNHIEPMVNRLKNNINIKNTLISEIRSRYSSFFSIIWQASSILVKGFEINKISETELSFLTLYFVAATKEIHVPVKIGIICPHGIATSELIISSIKELVTEFDEIKKIDLNEFKDNGDKNCDILISSVKLNIPSDQYCLVSPLLSTEDILRIQKKYLQITANFYKIDESNNRSINLSKSQFLSLVSKSIYLNRDFKSKNECIEFLVSKANDENSSNEMFFKSILDREKMGTTGIYTGIAIPHADPKYVQYSEVLFLTLHEPIVWDNCKISVIMLIAIRDEMEDTCKEALKYIYGKLNNKKYIDYLAQASSIDKFTKFL